MALELPVNIKTVNPIPLDGWAGPYTTLAAANAAVPSGVRYKGRQVIITPSTGDTYVAWWKNGITDQDLVVQTAGDQGLDFGTWTAATNKSSAIATEDITLRYKSDFSADEEKAITYVQGQFTLSSSTNSTNLILAQIPAIAAPINNIRYYIRVGGVSTYILLQSDGQMRLISEDGTTALPTGTSNAYSAFFIYNPIKEQERLPINTVMLTSFDEFGYDTNLRFASTEYGAGKSFNGVYEQVKLGIDPPQKSDFINMLDKDASLLPDLNECVMWINWFSPSMYQSTIVRPFIQETVTKSIAPTEWISGGYNASQVPIIPERLKGSGSMDDQAFINGCKELQRRGIKVGIVPVISTLDITKQAGEGYLNWRGYMIWDDFSQYQLFAIEYIKFIKYYLDLCKANGIDLSFIYVGSEFQCLLTANYTDSPDFGKLQGGWSSANQTTALNIKNHFIGVLGDLGTYAKSLFPLSVTTYAANWTEYNVLDDLWAKPGIDAIGIDWYFPLTKIHTNDEETLRAGVFGGEYAQYYLTGGNDQEYYVRTSSKVGKSLLTEVPITNNSYLAGLKRVREYIAYLATKGINKPVVATELGVASSEGSAVLPNVFPEVISQGGSSTSGNLTEVLDDNHNLKPFLTALSAYSLQVKNLKGPYGWDGQMDESHQFAALKVLIQELRANNINRQVIYNLDARPVDSFGATIYNTETNRNELYTADTPIVPLAHAINGKKAGGNPNGDLLDRITPNDSLTQPNPESTASRTIGSFISADVMDDEWKENNIPGYALCTDDGEYLNPNRNATGKTGRYAYFGSMGQRTPTIVRVKGRLSFTAKGEGTIEIILASSTDMQVQASRTFTLTTDWKDFNWTLPNLYPQLEMVCAVMVSGGNATNAKVAFKKNFGIILKQAGLNGNFVRLRADDTNLKGNAETDWYGWSDSQMHARKKYLQSSAFSKFEVNTDATELTIEVVRDFYDAPTKQLIPAIEIQNNRGLAANGTIIEQPGALATSVTLNDPVGTKYTFSGCRARDVQYAWMDENLNPVGTRVQPASDGVSDIKDTQWTDVPYYVITKTAANQKRLAFRVQRIINTTNYKAPENDSYKVYASILLERGAPGDPSPDYDTVPSDWKGYIGPVDSKVSGLGVFVDNVPFKYIQLEGNDIAKQINFVTVSDLPTGIKKVEIVHNGRGTYLPESPLIRRAGTYMRAIYLPESAGYEVITETVNGVCFVHDSILSGFNLSTFPQKNVWHQKIKRDPNYGYIGDVYSEGYAGRILHTDTKTPELLEAFAQKLARFPVDKYWFQIGVNDYGFITPIADFTVEYPALLDRLHELKPDSKFYIQTIGPEAYDGPNGESYNDPDDPDKPTGPPQQAFSDVQRDYANNRAWCELVEFDDLFAVTRDTAPDGIHPNDAGNILYTNGIRDKSSLLQERPTDIKIIPQDIALMSAGIPYTQQFTSSGGQFPYVYTYTGTLPTGLTLSSSGLLSGTPELGEYNFTLKSTDADGEFVTRVFNILISDSLTGIPESSRSLSVGSSVNTDMYSEEWTFPLWTNSTTAGYNTVTDDGVTINAAGNASGNAARYIHFHAMGIQKSNPTLIKAKLSFEAKITGTIEIVIFYASNMAVGTRKKFTGTGTAFQAYTWDDITLYPKNNFVLGVFFNGMQASTQAKGQFKKNFSLQVENFSEVMQLGSLYKRYRADETNMIGNTLNHWFGYDPSFPSYQQGVYTHYHKKFMNHNPFAFLKFTTDATVIAAETVCEIVGDGLLPGQTNDGTNLNGRNALFGLSVFCDFPDGTTQYQYVTTTNWFADGKTAPYGGRVMFANGSEYGDQYNQQINQWKITLPAGTKTVRICASPGSVGTADMMEAHANTKTISDINKYSWGGVFMRAVYVPATASFTPVRTAKPHSMYVLLDSIGSGVYTGGDTLKTSWQYRLQQDYGYKGDVLCEGAAGMPLNWLAGDAGMRAVTINRLASHPQMANVDRILIQMVTNDMSAERGPGSSTVFKAYYEALIDGIHAVRPDIKFWLCTPGNAYYHTQLEYGQRVIEIVNARPSWCTLVDFSTTLELSDTYYATNSDFTHPNASGNIKMAAKLNSTGITTVASLGFSPSAITAIGKGIPYSQSFVGINVTGTATWSISQGSLPAGLTQSSTTGTISGTATTLGAYSFTVRVTDSIDMFERQYVGSVTEPVLTITPTTLGNTVKGTTIDQPLTTAGGITPYTYSINNGSLPTGVTYNSTSKKLVGEPTVAGTYTFRIISTDSASHTGYRDYTWVIAEPNLVLSPTTLTGLRQNVPVNQQFTTTGGVVPYTYSSTGTLPAGLTLSSTGLLSGTPTTRATYTFSIVVTDSKGNTKTQVFTDVLVDYESPYVVTPTISLVGGNVIMKLTSRFAPAGTIYAFANFYTLTGSTAGYVTGKNLTIASGTTSDQISAGTWSPAAGVTGARMLITSLIPASDSGTALVYPDHVDYTWDGTAFVNPVYTPKT